MDVVDMVDVDVDVKVDMNLDVHVCVCLCNAGPARTLAFLKSGTGWYRTRVGYEGLGLSYATLPKHFHRG